MSDRYWEVVHSETTKTESGHTVEYEVAITPEDIPLEGNLCAHEGDAECYQAVRDQLASGGVSATLAWCTIRVTATVTKYHGIGGGMIAAGWRGSDYLGGCSYPSLEAFTDETESSGYYSDMKAEALKAAYADKLVCFRCGSPECEVTAWYHVNSERVTASGNDGPTAEIWCPVCETHDTDLVSASDYPTDDRELIAMAGWSPKLDYPAEGDPSRKLKESRS